MYQHSVNGFVTLITSIMSSYVYISTDSLVLAFPSACIHGIVHDGFWRSNAASWRILGGKRFGLYRFLMHRAFQSSA